MYSAVTYSLAGGYLLVEDIVQDDADKPRGQSRSPNMVPFDMLGVVSY